MQTHHLSFPILFLVLVLLSLTGCGGGDSNNSGVDKEIQVSGTVTGLSRSSVSIKNRDGTPMTVSSDGSFSLSAQNTSGYDIRIERNPIEQLCHVGNGSAGSVSGNGHAGSGAHSYAIYDADLNDGQTPALIANSNQLSAGIWGVVGVVGVPGAGLTRDAVGAAGMKNF